MLNIDKTTNLVSFDTEYLNWEELEIPFNKREMSHVELAAHFAHQLKSGEVTAQMIIIEAEPLATEHGDDPVYCHKTNNLICCEAIEHARRALTNNYLDRDKLKAFMQEHELPDWRYNFKSDDPDEQERMEKEREFKFEVEDEIFHFQELKEAFEQLSIEMEQANTYLLDQYGYCQYEGDMEESEKEGVTFDEEGYALVTSEEIKAKQREVVLIRQLKPRVMTTYERVYNFPSPFCYWDYRSSWHQFFVLKNSREKTIKIFRGNSGSSGAREDNGRWAHAFAYLHDHYNILIPTYHLLYDEHNVLNHINTYESFRALPYDLSGNYWVDHEITDPLFKDKKLYSEVLNRKYNTAEETEDVECE